MTGLSPNRPKLTRVADGAVILLLALTIAWSLSREGRVMKIDSGRALARIAARTMELSAAYPQAPFWQRSIFVVNGVDIERNRRQVEAWYRELAQAEGSVSARCGLEMVSAPDKTPSADCAALDPATAVGNEKRELRISNRVFEKLCAFHGMSAALVLIGVVCFLGLSLRRRANGVSLWKLSGTSGEQPFDAGGWPGGIGLRGLGTVLVSGFIFVCLLTSVLADQMSVRAMCMFLGVLLTLLLVLYLQKHRHSLLALMGVGAEPGSVSSLAASTLALSGASIAGSSFIQWFFDQIGKPAHWTEWYNEDLVFGAPSLVGVLLIAKCAFSPLVEEIVFRGFLFGILRRAAGAPAAIVVSAVVFGFAHSSGLPTFLTITWCGLVWSFGYEKTGSIVPAVLSHSLNNILYSLSILVFLR